MNGETASALTTPPTCTASDNGGNPVSSHTPPGQYTITRGGAVAANYTITYVPGTLTIAPSATTLVLGPPSGVVRPSPSTGLAPAGLFPSVSPIYPVCLAWFLHARAALRRRNHGERGRYRSGRVSRGQRTQQPAHREAS